MSLCQSGDALADDKLSDHGDEQISESKPRVLGGGDAQAARNAGAGELAKVEASRTNKSDGSLALDKQNESIQLFDRDASGKERVLAARQIVNDVANLASQQTSISREELIIKGRAGDHAAVDLINQWRAADQLPREQKVKVGAKLQDDADHLYGRGAYFKDEKASSVDIIPLPKPVRLLTPLYPVPSPILHSEKAQDSMTVGDSLAPVDEKSKEGDALLNRSSFVAQKEQLQELVNQKIANPQEREQFLGDMASFEKHFSERSFKGDNEKLDEMAKTYTQLCRLLTAEQDVLDRYADRFKPAPDVPPMRIQAAEQIIFHAADPSTVDQGRRAVCPTAALQVRQYHRDPASVARLVADVVLTGSYTATTNDKKIDLTVCPPNLIPDMEARKYNIYDKIHGIASNNRHLDDSKRSWASQLYDVTATNLVLSGKCCRYEQLAFENEVKDLGTKGPEAKLSPPIDFLVNLDNGPKMTWHDAIERNAGVLDSEMVKLNRWIVGKREIGFLITGAMLSEEEAKDPQVREAYDFGHREYGEIYLYSVNDLPRILQEIQVAQAWPPIVRLDASMPPVGKAAANAHFLVIQAINDDGSKLAYDNFWGKEDDKTEATRVNTNEVAISVKHLAAKVPSLFGSAKNFATFCQNNQASWNQSKSTWLDIPTKIKCQSPPQPTSVYVNTHHSNDSILTNWIKQYPQDKDLSLWLQTLNEWLDKYPDEKPIDPK
jgi:hypothetical protein